jgi:hypothetical protein
MTDARSAARKTRKLRASRDLWEQRCAKKQQQIRQLRIMVRDLSRSRDHWRSRVKEREQQLQAVPEDHALIDPAGCISFGGVMNIQALPRTFLTSFSD